MSFDNQTNSSIHKTYSQLDTPFLFIDKQKLLQNLQRLRTKIDDLGSTLRPHFKTIRAIEAAKYVLPNKTSPVTVSTLKEAESLALEGYSNFLYAVGIAEAKFERVLTLIQKGCQIDIILDSVEQAQSLNTFCFDNQCNISALIEIDCDGHRGGIQATDPLLIEIANLLHKGHAKFLGVLTHAGESYHCFEQADLTAAAANEVDQILQASALLTANDIPCEVTSIGSTPTAHSYQNLEGVTEVRAGVYSFFDLVMAGIGVCGTNDIAVSAVATVIGHNREKGWLFIDAGWMALSSDRGTSDQPKDCGYGLIADINGNCIDDLFVETVNQEHGIIKRASGSQIDFEQFPIGSRLHILPNHACAITAMHDYYHVFDNETASYETWTRIKGW